LSRHADGVYADIKKHLEDTVFHLLLDAGDAAYIFSKGIYARVKIRGELFSRRGYIAIIGLRAFSREVMGSFKEGRDLIGQRPLG
jgi:hypothetical protein